SVWATTDGVLAAAIESSPWLYAVGLVAAALSAAYSGKILWTLWRRRSRAKLPVDAIGTVTTQEQVPLVVLAVGAAVLGALALPPLSRLLTAALRGHRAPDPGWALGWLGLEATAHALIVRPSLALAHALARFDDQVVDRSLNALAGVVPVFARGAARVDDEGIDRGVEVIAGAVPVLAKGAARVDDGVVDRGVEVIAGRVRRLGQLARLPQTGAVHQYLLQAVVVLTV